MLGTSRSERLAPRVPVPSGSGAGYGLISWFPVYSEGGWQAHDRAGVLRAHRAGRWPAAWVRHRARGRGSVAGPGGAEDRQPVWGAGPARRRGADRARPGGGARRPAAPLLPADPGRAARAGRGGRGSRRCRACGAGEAGPDGPGGIGSSRVSGGPGLEQRYRRVLRLLPGYYRQRWEEDMVAAFLDSWTSGDPDDDEWVLQFCKPTWPEVASVAGLAARLYLGGAATPRRYFAWGQAVRRAVLAVMLVHAVLGLELLVRTAWSRRLFGLPAPPASLVVVAPSGVWPAVFNLVNVAWIVIFVTLVLGRYRTARVLAALAIIPGLAAVLQAQLTGIMPAPFGRWAWWVLFDLALVLAMAAFHQDAPLPARLPWLLALPIGYLLVYVPVLALVATGNTAWLPDLPGLLCMVVALACLAHVPWAWSRQAGGSGVWSLTLVLLALVFAAFR